MRSLIILPATILCLTITVCSKDSGGKSATDGGTTSGRGSINVSGERNTVTTLGAANKGTRVGCLRNPGINYSDIVLTVEGQSKFRADASESLSIVGGAKDCHANLSPVGSTSLSGTISCKGLVGQHCGKIDIQAGFECSVQTLN